MLNMPSRSPKGSQDGTYQAEASHTAKTTDMLKRRYSDPNRTRKEPIMCVWLLSISEVYTSVGMTAKLVE